MSAPTPPRAGAHPQESAPVGTQLAMGGAVAAGASPSPAVAVSRRAGRRARAAAVDAASQNTGIHPLVRLDPTPAQPPVRGPLSQGEVRLHIGSVVLRGIDLRGREAFAGALREELARLIEERGVSSTDDAGGRDEVMALRLRPRPSPDSLGVRLARLVYTRLQP